MSTQITNAYAHTSLEIICIESTSRCGNMPPVGLTVGDVTVTLLVNNEKVYDIVMTTLICGVSAFLINI